MIINTIGIVFHFASRQKWETRKNVALNNRATVKMPLSAILLFQPKTVFFHVPDNSQGLKKIERKWKFPVLNINCT
jgi:hypothetical protein